MIRRSMISAVLPAFVAICSCGPSNALYQISGHAMGTTYQIRYVIDDANNGSFRKTLAQSIRSQLETLEQAMSSFRQDSELSRFNNHHSEAPFSVTPTTAEVFEISRIISEMTGGAFDITAGAVIDAWGFGPAGKANTIPDRSTLEPLQERVGYQTIDVDRAALLLRKKRPGIICDLSAVAKGYGVDRLAHLLEDSGVDRYMIELGGEVRTRGLNDQGSAWQIAIERPLAGSREIEIVVPLTDQALATSGDYRNFFDYHGERFSHVIDPRIGRPIRHRLASVSVLHDECAYADALATALLVMGPEDGLEQAEKLGLKALFILRISQSEFRTLPTSGFSAYLEGAIRQP
jgi:thiamine biosynthesis lipoprotein